MNVLRSKIPAFGGLKVFFVNSMFSTNGAMIAGSTGPKGTIINAGSNSLRGRTWAHEFCHSCGLRDLFLTHSNTSLIASGEIRESWMPDDWGRYLKNGTNELPLEAFAPRLLMFWQPVKLDIPSGDVYGLWYYWENNDRHWNLSNTAVGLSGMTNTPVHQ